MIWQKKTWAYSVGFASRTERQYPFALYAGKLKVEYRGAFKGVQVLYRSNFSQNIIEYAMISGLNDSDECARELSSRLRGMLCHVNLIPVNNVRENNYVRSDRERLRSFSEILQKTVSMLRFAERSEVILTLRAVSSELKR